MFENYKDWLFHDKIILKSQQRFKSNHHEVYTQEFNKIVLSSDDDKDYKHVIELQYIHTEQMFVIVCESKMMIARYLFVEKYANCTFYDETILQRQR